MKVCLVNWATDYDLESLSDDMNDLEFAAYPRGIVVRDLEPATVEMFLQRARDSYVEDYDDDRPIVWSEWKRKDKEWETIWECEAQYGEDRFFLVVVAQPRNVLPD